MAYGTLNAIVGKFRRLTGENLQTTATSGDINSVGIYDYINSFYNYDFPAQFRSLKLKDVYTFNTIMGQDVYAFNSEIATTVEMPCYCAKREIQLFNEPWTFYGVNYNWQQMQNFTSGNGTAGPYSGTITGLPFIKSVNNQPYASVASNPYTPSGTNYGTANIPGVSQGQPAFAASRVQNILITANTATGTCNVTDDGNGNLIGDLSTSQPQGTINYQTGAISGLYFNQVIPGGNQIQIQYNPIPQSIPLSIMFYQNQFTLRPVPDRGYTIEVTVYRQPTQALAQISAGGGTPELTEWWECIAVGAAKKRFEDRLDMDGVAVMDKMLKERYDVCYTRTYAQLGSQRIPTIYSDQLDGSYANNNGWGFSSGSQ
jgi:hypothetical protein